MPLPNYDGSDVVLFPDETSQNLRFISGPFSLSNSRHRGKMGIDTTSGTTRMTAAVRNNAKPVMTCDEPLDGIDVHGAQRPKMLSSLFYVDMHLHHDVKVQY